MMTLRCISVKVSSILNQNDGINFYQNSIKSDANTLENHTRICSRYVWGWKNSWSRGAWRASSGPRLAAAARLFFGKMSPPKPKPPRLLP